MKIAFVYMQGRIGRLQEAARGEAPSEFFYGALELADAGVEVCHFEINPEAGRGWISAGINLVQRAKVGPFKTDGRTIRQAAAMCGTLNGFELVVATASKIGFAFSMCAAAGLLQTPILAIQCGLLNEPHGRLRHASMRWLLSRMHSMLFGESELAPMQEAFGLSPAQLSVNQFGVDTDFWSPGEEPAPAADFVLSIGNDGRRDFHTLLEAAPQIPGAIQLITSRKLPAVLPANVTHLRGSWHARALSDVELRTLYRQARAVVVPLTPSLQPSGQSVALQAMACGIPVVLTDTEGLWSRAMMRDQENVLLCRPRDPADLAAKVRRLLQDPELAGRLGRAARQTACSEGNIRRFAQTLQTFAQVRP